MLVITQGYLEADAILQGYVGTAAGPAAGQPLFGRFRRKKPEDRGRLRRRKRDETLAACLLLLTDDDG